jgi:undecaprenyl phosphate N,N'-diacetylbacillosamine 1-phosphate transferase
MKAISEAYTNLTAVTKDNFVPKSFYNDYGKRFLDILVAGSMLLVLAPLMTVVAFLVYRANGGNPLFFQKRPGKNGKVFLTYKFKTMTDAKDASGKLLPDEQRLFPTGQLLRKLSLDELPQLLNVLKGDMSLIGPRPLLVQYLPLYNSYQSHRHDVTPGITGLAQTRGRNALSWERRFRYDVFYVKNLSFLLDMKILWETFSTVFKTEGVEFEVSSELSYFLGTPKRPWNKQIVNTEISNIDDNFNSKQVGNR